MENESRRLHQSAPSKFRNALKSWYHICALTQRFTPSENLTTQVQHVKSCKYRNKPSATFSVGILDVFFFLRGKPIAISDVCLLHEGAKVAPEHIDYYSLQHHVLFEILSQSTSSL